MKRYLALLFVFVLLLSLASCGSKPAEPEAPAPEEAPALEQPEPEEEPAPSKTVGEENALRAAESYLSFMAFSQKGLTDQLKFDGYSDAEIAFAVEQCGADWNEQAVKAADSYLSFMAFSYDGLVDQLKFDGYTEEQAIYGADAVYGNPASDDAGSSSDDAAPAPDTADNGSASAGEKNALRSAESYLSFTAFSYTSLVDQLKFDGYSETEAAYAADHCGADWNEQAVKSAESYLSFMSFSYDGLVDQLKFDGFTAEQAAYGADAVYGGSASTDAGSGSSSAGQENALRSAESYLSFMAFSYKGLVEQLVFDGYSEADAAYAADHCGADWNEQAAKSAESYLSFMAFSRSGLIEQLEFDGFTHEQAVYGAEQNGY